MFITASKRRFDPIIQEKDYLQPEARLKHVPILHPQVAEEDRIEGVRAEMEAVAAVLSGVEVVGPPDHRAVLSSDKNIKERKSHVAATPSSSSYEPCLT